MYYDVFYAFLFVRFTYNIIFMFYCWLVIWWNEMIFSFFSCHNILTFVKTKNQTNLSTFWSENFLTRYETLRTFAAHVTS